SATWSIGPRGRRIREVIEATRRMTREDCQALQLDTRSGRAAALVPPLLKALADDPDRHVRQAAERLAGWDYRVTAESVPAALFNVFFAHWCRRVTGERFAGETAALVAGGAAGLAAQLLEEDRYSWFGRCGRIPA